MDAAAGSALSVRQGAAPFKLAFTRGARAGAKFGANNPGKWDRPGQADGGLVSLPPNTRKPWDQARKLRGAPSLGI